MEVNWVRTHQEVSQSAEVAFASTRGVPETATPRNTRWEAETGELFCEGAVSLAAVALAGIRRACGSRWNKAGGEILVATHRGHISIC